jgi:hypothetical protein
MTYTAKEKKLIALAMNGAAHAGELANAATAFFKSLGKRRVRYADMVDPDESNLALLREQLSAAKANEIHLNDSILSLTHALEKKEKELNDQISSAELSFAMVADQRDHITWYCKQSKEVAVKLKELLEDQKSMFPVIVEGKVMVPKRRNVSAVALAKADPSGVALAKGETQVTMIEILPNDPDYQIWTWIASGLT